MDKKTFNDFENENAQMHNQGVEKQEKAQEKKERLGHTLAIVDAVSNSGNKVVTAIGKIPKKIEVTNFPDQKPFPDDISVNNLTDYNPKFDELNTSIKGIKLTCEPNIEVKASDVNIKSDFSKLETMLKETVDAFKAVKIEYTAPNIEVKPTKVTVSNDFSLLETKLENLTNAMTVTKADIESRINLQDFKISDSAEPVVGYQYFGFVDSIGRWYILFNDIETSEIRYKFGLDNYMTNWMNNTELSYKLLNEAINEITS